MQAFRAAVTVGTSHEVHLAPVPFRPGSVVEVIVLEEPQRDRSAGAEAPEQRSGRPWKAHRTGVDLAREQYRLAQRHPEEYVVLVEDRVVFHSPDRRLAFRAYSQAVVDSPASYPVIVQPGDEPQGPFYPQGSAASGDPGLLLPQPAGNAFYKLAARSTDGCLGPY